MKSRYSAAGAALHDLLSQIARAEAELAPLLARGGRALLLQVALGPPRTVAELARARGASRQGVQRVANDLLRRGWVEARPNPRHRRAPLLAPTARGRERSEALRGEQAARLNELAANLDAGALRAAARLLRSLGVRAGANPGERLTGCDPRAHRPDG